MNLTLENLKEEAIARMQLIGLDSDLIEQFRTKGVVKQSKPPKYDCESVEEEQLERIKEFERERHALVYFVIRSFTSIGTMDAFLYVSDCPEKWKLEREALKEKTSLAYVYNYDTSTCSEIGSLGFELTNQGGLRRTA